MAVNLGEIFTTIGADVKPLKDSTFEVDKFTKKMMGSLADVTESGEKLLTDVDIKGIEKAEKAIDKFAKKAKTSFIDVSKKFESAGQKMTGIGKNVTIATAGFGALGVAAVKASMNLNKGMAEVSTLIPKNTERVMELRDAVRTMSKDTGKSTEDLTGGLYEVISAFGDTADTIKILETNAKSATASMTDTQTAIKLSSAVTKAYGDTSAEANKRVNDMAFKLVELGQTTYPEVAASIGDVTGSAKQLGVTQEELFGTIATLTGVTGNASKVTTQLNATFSKLMAPTEELRKGLSGVIVELVEQKKIGGPLVDEYMKIQNALAVSENRMEALRFAGMKGTEEFKKQKEATKNLEKQMRSATAGLVPLIVQEKGLMLTLKDVANAAGGNADSLKKMMASEEAMRAVLPLTTTLFDEAGRKIGEMGKSAEAGTVAYTEFTTGIGKSNHTWKQLTASVADLMVTIGDELLPVFHDLMTNVLTPLINDYLIPGAKAFSGLDDSTKRLIIGLGGVVIAIGPLLLVFGTVLTAVGKVGVAFATVAKMSLTKKFAGALVNITKVAIPGLIKGFTGLITMIGGGLKIALTAILGPFGAVALAIGSVALAGYQLIKHWDDLKLTAKAFGQVLKFEYQALKNNIVMIVKGIYAASKQWLIDRYQGIRTGISNFINTTINYWKAAPGRIVGYFQQIYAGAKMWLVDRFDSITSWVVDKINILYETWRRLKDALVGNSIIPEMVKEIGFQFQLLGDDILNPTEETMKRLVAVYDKASKKIVGYSLVPGQGAAFSSDFSFRNIDDMSESAYSAADFSVAFAKTSQDWKRLKDAIVELQNTVVAELGPILYSFMMGVIEPLSVKLDSVYQGFHRISDKSKDLSSSVKGNVASSETLLSVLRDLSKTLTMTRESQLALSGSLTELYKDILQGTKAEARSLAEYLRTGFALSLGSVIAVFSQVFHAGYQLIVTWSEFANLMETETKEVYRSVSYWLADRFVPLMSDVRKHPNDIINRWKTTAREVWDSCKDIFEAIDGWLVRESGKLISAVVYQWSMYAREVEKYCMLAYQAVEEWLVKKFRRYIGDITSDLNFLITKWNQLRNVMADSRTPTGDVIAAFQHMHDEIVGNSIVPDMMEQIERQFDRIRDLMLSPVEDVATKIIRVYDNMSKRILEYAFIPDQRGYVSIEYALDADGIPDVPVIDTVSPEEAGLKEMYEDINNLIDIIREFTETGTHLFEQMENDLYFIVADIRTDTVFNFQGMVTEVGAMWGSFRSAAMSAFNAVGNNSTNVFETMYETGVYNTTNMVNESTALLEQYADDAVTYLEQVSNVVPDFSGYESNLMTALNNIGITINDWVTNVNDYSLNNIGYGVTPDFTGLADTIDAGLSSIKTQQIATGVSGMNSTLGNIGNTSATFGGISQSVSNGMSGLRGDVSGGVTLINQELFKIGDTNANFDTLSDSITDAMDGIDTATSTRVADYINPNLGEIGKGLDAVITANFAPVTDEGGTIDDFKTAIETKINSSGLKGVFDDLPSGMMTEWNNVFGTDTSEGSAVTSFATNFLGDAGIKGKMDTFNETTWFNLVRNDNGTSTHSRWKDACNAMATTFSNKFNSDQTGSIKKHMGTFSGYWDSFTSAIETNWYAAMNYVATGSYATGGYVQGYAAGGEVGGLHGRDRVPAYLTAGEYVIQKPVVDNLGKDYFDKLNSAKKYAAGGLIGWIDGTPSQEFILPWDGSNQFRFSFPWVQRDEWWKSSGGGYYDLDAYISDYKLRSWKIGDTGNVNTSNVSVGKKLWNSSQGHWTEGAGSYFNASKQSEVYGPGGFYMRWSNNRFPDWEFFGNYLIRRFDDAANQYSWNPPGWLNGSYQIMKESKTYNPDSWSWMTPYILWNHMGINKYGWLEPDRHQGGISPGGSINTLPGEYVVNPASTARYRDELEDINAGTYEGSRPIVININVQGNVIDNPNERRRFMRYIYDGLQEVEKRIR